MSYGRKRVYITYKHQCWTSGNRYDLLEDLDGYDDKILEFYVWDDDFAIITRNGYTYDVKDSRQDAQNFIDSIYSAYDIYDQNDEYCYIPVNNPDVGYLCEEDAREDGYYDVIYIPRGYHYLVKNGRVLAKSWSKDELYQIMDSDYGADFDFIS